MPRTEGNLLSQSILQPDEFIKDQDGVIGAHCLDGPPIVPARVKVLVFGQVVFFEVVGQRLRQLDLQLVQGRLFVRLRVETVKRPQGLDHFLSS